MKYDYILPVFLGAMKHIYVPTQVFASGESSVMADFWIAAMVMALGVITWMVFTGRLFRRHR